MGKGVEGFPQMWIDGRDGKGEGKGKTRRAGKEGQGGKKCPKAGEGQGGAGRGRCDTVGGATSSALEQNETGRPTAG